jgi:predicted histidine transporter YuiF (NhaC family)
MLSDPLALVIAALGSVVGALTFVFGLYIKAQDRAYNEMKVMADARHADMKAENARLLASQEVSERNDTAVLLVIRSAVEGVASGVNSQTRTLQLLERWLERASDEDVRHGRR